MELTDKQKSWIIKRFRNTKNGEIMLKIGITHSSLHRFARANGLTKTKQFVRKCQAATTKAARVVNKRNNWPPKGYVIPKSVENRFKKGVTPSERLGKRKNAERIIKLANSRAETVKAEKRRVMFGLEQKTKLKVVSGGHLKAAYRYTLKKRGYIVARDARDILYNENTDRSAIVERTGSSKYKFNFKES